MWNRHAAITVLIVALVSLGNGACYPVPIPDNAIDTLLQNQPATRCSIWLDTIVDVYMRKMECSADDNTLSIDNRKPVEYHGHEYHPVTVSWFTDPPGSTLLRIRDNSASLERLMAPLVGAESVFRDAESGEPRDLFPRGFVARAILGPSQISGEPPIELVGMDLAIASAKLEYSKRLRELGATVSSPRTPAIDRLNHAGPVQEAMLPLARALAERCREQLQDARMITELAASPGCKRALPIDPFLKALFGEQRLGQAVTLRTEARAAWPSVPLHHSTLRPSEPNSRPAN